MGPRGGLWGLLPSCQVGMSAPAHPLGQPSLWKLVRPQGSLCHPGLASRRCPPGTGAGLASARRGKSLPGNSVKSWSCRQIQPEGTNFENHILIQTMQPARSGERAARKGREEERGHHNSWARLQGVGDSGLLPPLPRQTLEAIFKQPTVPANLGWIWMLPQIENQH